MTRLGIILLILLLVVVALAAGFSFARPFDRYDPVAEARADRIRVATQVYAAREAALRPVKVFLYALTGVAGILVSGLVAWAGFLYLERRARTIYPDSHGVMPAVVLRPGEIIVDLGALAGPAIVTSSGLRYALPENGIVRLQEGANRGAAATRTMRAWATRLPSARESLPNLPVAQESLPPVEVLTGDEAHIIRLLEEAPS